MYYYPVSLVFGLFAMCCIIVSYFGKAKTHFMLFQMLAFCGYSLSYLFIEQFFAMASVLLAVVRVAVFFLYEKKDKAVPMWLQTLFAVATLICYIVINPIILKQTRAIDILLVVSNILYTYCFGLRNIKAVRYFMLAPTSLTILYNIFLPATLFVILSYGFELLSDVLSIFKYYVFGKEKAPNEAKEKLDEND